MERAEERRLFVALTALPLLHSLPQAQAKLFIDFDGNGAIPDWLGTAIPAQPAFDRDGNANDFSALELSDIQNIWQRVSELFSPFNIDVTTQDPGNRDNRRTAHIVFGDTADHWLKAPAGGVAPLGGFFNGAPNTGFVFAEDAAGFNFYLGETVAHEAGHLFGLYHHSIFDADGNLVEEYDPGTPEKGPIMGDSQNSIRSIWSNTIADINNEPTLQDDLAVLSGSTNGFGYRTDDWGNTRLSATTVQPASDGTFTRTGVIERNGDVDAFNIKAGTGTLTVSVNNATFSPMLDSSIKVVDPFGSVIAQASTTELLDESLSVNILAGTYTIMVSGAGSYGDLGQYTLNADVPLGASTSDHLLVEGTDFDDVITINLVDGAYQLTINDEVQTIDPATIKQFDILVGGGNDFVSLGTGVPSSYILGGDGSDTLIGGDFADTISGSAGNDQIFGGGADDRLAGGAGHDILVGGNARDRMYGDAGNDVMRGGSSVDRLYGGDGSDVLSGEGSDDKCYGELGNDSIYGGDGSDLLNGGDGLDQIYGQDGNDVMFARDLTVDLLNGGSGRDQAETEDDDTQISLEELLP